MQSLLFLFSGKSLQQFVNSAIYPTMFTKVQILTWIDGQQNAENTVSKVIVERVANFNASYNRW